MTYASNGRPLIFLSYRRIDSCDATDRICRALRADLGREAVARDIDAIPPGAEWREYLKQRIRESDVVLAVMGHQWPHTAEVASGTRLLERPDDPVRMELETARDAKVRIVPVSVGGAAFPTSPQVPGVVAWICDLNGVPVRPDPDFDGDVARLGERLRALVGAPAGASVPATPEPAARGAEPAPEDVARFGASVRRSYRLYETSLPALNDPATVYVDLDCQPFHDDDSSPSMSRSPTNAVDYLLDGVADRKAQVVLANYGMGKSFLALELFRRLISAYARDPVRHPLPVLMPLKDLHLPRRDPTALLRRLRAFLDDHGLAVGGDTGLKRLLEAGRLCFVLDGVDEIPLYQAESDPRVAVDLLDKIDFRRFGPCPWVATSRTSYFAAALPALRGARTYRLCCLIDWSESRWRGYVAECHRRISVFSDEAQRDSFLVAVARTPALAQLSRTPLLARMLVETSSSIVERPDEVNLIRLYGRYADQILRQREDHSALPDLESRRQCLESAAAHLHTSSGNSCDLDDLVRIADSYLMNIHRPDLVSFVRQELQTFSLLVLDLDAGTLGFSHKSFYEYFLALAISRQVAARGWLDAPLLSAARLDPGGAGFLGALLREPASEAAFASLAALLAAGLTVLPDLQRRNLVLAALAAQRAASSTATPVTPLARADLRETDLSSMDFSHCMVEGANLVRVTAVGASFVEARLRGCRLDGANLVRCDLGGADLRGASLRSANLSELAAAAPPRLAGAELRGIIVPRQLDAALLERAVVMDPDGDEAWRRSALRAIRKGFGAQPGAPAPPPGDAP